MLSGRSFGESVETGCYTLVDFALEQVDFSLKRVAESFVRSERVESGVRKVGNGFVNVFLNEVVGIADRLLDTFSSMLQTFFLGR